jgi:hypothetical protein
MQFALIEDYYAVSRTTGPSHNLLLLRLAVGNQNTPECECLPPVGSCIHKPLSETALVSKVVEGVAEANAQFGTQYSATHIRYFQNDTGPEVVYGFLALKIIQHLVTGGEFLVAQPPKGENAL